MTSCSICTTDYPDLELKRFSLSGERELLVCEDCQADAMADYVDNIEKAKRNWCAGCPQYTKDGCLAGVTPDTCC